MYYWKYQNRDMLSKKSIGFIIIFFTLFSGVMTSISKYSGIDFLSIQNLVTLIFFLFFTTLVLIKYIKINRFLELAFIVYFVIKVCFNFILYSDIVTNINDFLTVLNFYFLFKYFLNLNVKSKLKLIRNLDYYFVIISIIAIIQLIFKDSLPEVFKELPQTGEAAISSEKFNRETIEGVVYRPNGLVGNPLSLGLLLNIFLYIRFYFKQKVTDVKNLIFVLVNIGLITILNSRANTVLMLIILIYWGIKRKGEFKKLLALGILTFFLLSTYLYTYLKLMSERITNKDPYAIASTLEHLNDYLRALSYINSNPFFGYSRSFVLANEIITDGAIFLLILRHGLIGFILFIVSIYGKQLWQDIKIPIILLLACSILNSTLLSAINFYFLAIILGLSSQTKWKI